MSGLGVAYELPGEHPLIGQRMPTWTSVLRASRNCFEVGSICCWS
ncbi:hypothetical protein [Kribbella qitaiheensis]|nr:hypothetical protein [Kribbella qitaiheensis]